MTLSVPFDVKQITLTEDEKRGIFEGYAAVFGNTDWYGDVIVKGAFQKTLEKWARSQKNIPLLYQHNPAEVIGVIMEAKEDDHGLWVRGEINLETEKGKEVYALMKQGALYGLSIGFEAKKTQLKGDVRYLLEIELWEISIVTFPANELAEVVSVKTVVPFQDLPLAPRETPWDANKARQRVARWASSDGSGDKDTIDWSKYRKAFLWYDSENPENFGSYKFPIADIVNGRLMAVPRGIFAAAAIIQGARGGTNLPEQDVEKMKRHLEKYYAKLDMTPPWKNKGLALVYDLYGIVYGEEKLNDEAYELLSAIRDRIDELLSGEQAPEEEDYSEILSALDELENILKGG